MSPPLSSTAIVLGRASRMNNDLWQCVMAGNWDSSLDGVEGLISKVENSEQEDRVKDAINQDHRWNLKSSTHISNVNNLPLNLFTCK